MKRIYQRKIHLILHINFFFFFCIFSLFNIFFLFLLFLPSILPKKILCSFVTNKKLLSMLLNCINISQLHFALENAKNIWIFKFCVTSICYYLVVFCFRIIQWVQHNQQNRKYYGKCTTKYPKCSFIEKFVEIIYWH